MTGVSEKALRDLNATSGSERRNADSSKGDTDKSHIAVANENLEHLENKNYTTVDTALEVGNSEVEYVESENLNDVEDIESTVKTLIAGLDSKHWVMVCEALNNARRLAIYHKELMLDILGDVILRLVKSLKSPRSAVCKTAIMASADIFKAYNDQIIDSVDDLVVQLLLKASQDKRFVCEAAERALVVMTTWFSPKLLLPKLEPHLKNKNPRIRAKASMCFSRSVPRLGVEGIRAFGIDKLTQMATSQLSDQLPESREAARFLLQELQDVYEKIPELSLPQSENPVKRSWADFCQSILCPLSAQAVLRVTNSAQKILVSGS